MADIKLNVLQGMTLSLISPLDVLQEVGPEVDDEVESVLRRDDEAVSGPPLPVVWGQGLHVAHRPL